MLTRADILELLIEQAEAWITEAMNKDFGPGMVFLLIGRLRELEEELQNVANLQKTKIHL